MGKNKKSSPQNSRKASSKNPLEPKAAGLPKVKLPRIPLPKIAVPTVEIPKTPLPKVTLPTIQLPPIVRPSHSIPGQKAQEQPTKNEDPSFVQPKPGAGTEPQVVLKPPDIRFPTIRLPAIRPPVIKPPASLNPVQEPAPADGESPEKAD